MTDFLHKHWRRLKRSLSRRFREKLLPRGYRRLGTRYGGWWVDTTRLGKAPLLIDCGLGEDISFPLAFLQAFGGKVIGVEPNPRSLKYCEERIRGDMRVIPKAFWSESGKNLEFFLPRAQQDLPKGADGVSGSLDGSHEYAGGSRLEVETTSLAEILQQCARAQCDVLKMDIEGAEYGVLEQLCRSGEIRNASQVLIEFHHKVTGHSLEDTRRAVEQLQRSGFQLVHTEDRNYIFRRQELGHEEPVAE
jgi:FkbM family methyltransferase